MPLVKVHVEPFAGYLTKYKKLSDLPMGATIAIPNDLANSGCSLILLAKFWAGTTRVAQLLNDLAARLAPALKFYAILPRDIGGFLAKYFLMPLIIASANSS